MKSCELKLKKYESGYVICVENSCIGTVQFYDNPFHMQNCYLKIKLTYSDNKFSARLFKELKREAGRPLQVMISSADVSLAEFLKAGGFVCKRKCYEVKATVNDFVGRKTDMRLFSCQAGDNEYDIACKMMFDYYALTHKSVNPCTADFQSFCRSLPAEVIFAEKKSAITSLAFIDKNEIAYVCGSDKSHFQSFACNLVSKIFEKYGEVVFESDNCDWAATSLMKLFKNQSETSIDTYVYTRE